jgi:transcriptional regulator with XRE-family HTH domain
MVKLRGVVGRCQPIHAAAPWVPCDVNEVDRRLVTRVRPQGSPTASRRELGAALKALRTRKGLTAEQVSKKTFIGTTKLSRLETGDRGAANRDINDLCDLYEVDDQQREHLLELARRGKERAWWQPLGLPYSKFVGLEDEAVAIYDYGLGIIPGLLQTPEYARAIVRGMVYRWSSEEVEVRVEGRMARQQNRLLSAKAVPHFEAVMEESLLHRVVGSEAIMRAQLERLLELSKLPNVTLRVVPFSAGAPPAANNKFIILEFGQLDLPDVVYFEGLTGDLYLDDPRDVGIYRRTFATLTRQAADPEATYELISAIIAAPRT